MVLAAFDPMALVDAQVVVLFVPVALAGAMAGYALASVFSRDEHDRAAAPGVLVRGGVVTLLIVLFFLWIGSVDLRDVPRLLLSPWCAMPTVLGVGQLGLGLRLRATRRPRNSNAPE